MKERIGLAFVAAAIAYAMIALAQAGIGASKESCPGEDGPAPTRS